MQLYIKKSKTTYILMALVLVGVLQFAGCGSASGNAGRTGSKNQGVEDVLKERMAEEDGNATTTENDVASDSVNVGIDDGATTFESNTNDNNTSKNADGIDIDLTTQSATMVYTEVYNMMISPKEYVGKVVKMQGQYNEFLDDNTGKRYFACIIADATACCTQGLEFNLKDKYTYPDDYPKNEEEICVVGTFDTYKEGEDTFCTLKDAKLVNIKK